MKAKAESKITLTMTMEEAIALNSYLVSNWEVSEEVSETRKVAMEASVALDEVGAFSDPSKYRVVE